MKMIWQLCGSLVAYELGIVGVLTEAKYLGRINAIKPYLDTLREAAGFRVHQALYVRVLQDAGEF